MDSKTTKDSAFIFFPCNHYDYEFKKCSSFSNKIYKSFYGDESSDDNCNYYQNLYLDCLKYQRDPINNFSLLLNLSKYENEVVNKRLDSVKNNDVWELRKQPPIDWNTQLPSWAADRIKNTFWHKSLKNEKF